MSNLFNRDDNGNPNLDAFNNNGFWYGLPIGALIGVLIAGPHFHEWPTWESLVAIFGSCLGCGISGHLAIAMAYGAEASGAHVVPDYSDENSSDSQPEKSSDHDGND